MYATNFQMYRVPDETSMLRSMSSGDPSQYKVPYPASYNSQQEIFQRLNIRNPNWSEEETDQMIQLWIKMQPKCFNYSNVEFYACMASELQRMYNSQRSGTSIRIRLQNLKQRYKLIAKKTPVQDYPNITWKYFSTFHQYFAAKYPSSSEDF